MKRLVAPQLLLVIACVELLASVAWSQQTTSDDLQTQGAFGFPAENTFDRNGKRKVKPARKPLAAARVKRRPGKTVFIRFPELGKTWRDVPARAGVYLPTDYTDQRKFPLFVWFGGGPGSDDPARAAAIFNGAGCICVALPYRNDANGQMGGWQTPWSYYQTMLEKVEATIPNIDADRRACGGFSSGGAAILHQIGNSDEAFQNYFHAFVPGGAGWPMGGLDTIKNRPMLAFMGENDKRIVNYETLNESAVAAGVDFTFLKIPDTKHQFPESIHAQIRDWLEQKLVMPRQPSS